MKLWIKKKFNYLPLQHKLMHLLKINAITQGNYSKKHLTSRANACVLNAPEI
jgi:hypothetical protein